MIEQELPRGNMHAGYIARDRYKNTLIKQQDTPVYDIINNCLGDLFSHRYDENYINGQESLKNSIGLNLIPIRDLSKKYSIRTN